MNWFVKLQCGCEQVLSFWGAMTFLGAIVGLIIGLLIYLAWPIRRR